MKKYKLTLQTHPYLDDFLYAYTYARTPIAAMHEADALIYMINDQEYLGVDSLRMLEVSGSAEGLLGFKHNLKRIAPHYLNYKLEPIKTSNITPDADFQWNVLKPLKSSMFNDEKFNVVVLSYYALATMVDLDKNHVATPISNEVRKRVVKDCASLVAEEGMLYANITHESSMYPPSGKLKVPKRFSYKHLDELKTRCVLAGMHEDEEIVPHSVDVTFINSTLKETHHGEDFIIDVGHAIVFKGECWGGLEFELTLQFKESHTKHIYYPCVNAITTQFLSSIGFETTQYYAETGDFGEAFLFEPVPNKRALDSSYVIGKKG